MSRHANPTPTPLEQAPDLFALMPLCGVNDFKGSLGAVHLCPVCKGLAPDTPPGETQPGIETLRIHVNTHNEVVVRCHCCGLAESALGLVRRNSELVWAQIPELLEQHRVFGDRPVPEGWVERAESWERFARMFEKSKALFRRLSRDDQYMDVPFGEMGVSLAHELERTLPGVRLTSQWGKMTQFIIELHRSMLGLPTQVLIRHRRKGQPVASFAFQHPEPIDLWMPEWAPYRDWSNELILFSDLGIAANVVGILAKHPSGISPPAAWVANCRGQVADEIPARTVRYLHSENESPELALAFVQPGVRSMVSNEDAIGRVADYIIERTKHADPISYLHTVLQKTWITPLVEERLTRAVCDRLGEGAANLIARSGAADRILPCRIGSITYLCRRGIYLKQQGQKELQPCTNFSLRLDHTVVGGKEPLHQVLLIMETGTTRFTVTEDHLQDGEVLLKQAVAAANAEAFKDLPRVFDRADIKRLPRIVLATQLKPAVYVEAPPALGFHKGQFHGPNFTATVHGVDFRTSTEEPVSSMLPEHTWPGMTDHLSCRANELANRMAGLEPAHRRIMAVMLNAALAWLHRGSRGLPSYLLLPSEAHLELLGKLTGLVPIEVGRGDEENPSAPRIMRSSYWKPEQFERHGRIVAALEDRQRRTDPRLPIVVHHWPDNDSPMPSSILSLLTYSVLGARDLEGARERLASLVECPEIRRSFSGYLGLAEIYLAGPHGYLDAFMAALQQLPRPGKYLIRKSDKSLLKREVVKELRERRDFSFRETRLIDELRERYPFNQPARYGREGVPVFRMPAEVMMERQPLPG
ncbi:MAG: hypothetical protein ABJQ29_15665 [Luteolibacter sp.]